MLFDIINLSMLVPWLGEAAAGGWCNCWSFAHRHCKTSSNESIVLGVHEILSLFRPLNSVISTLHCYIAANVTSPENAKSGSVVVRSVQE